MPNSPEGRRAEHDRLRDDALSILRGLVEDSETICAETSDGFELRKEGITQQVVASEVEEVKDLPLFRVAVETEVKSLGNATQAEPLIQVLNRKATLSSLTHQEGSYRWHCSLLFHESSDRWAFQTVANGVELQRQEALQTKELLNYPEPELHVMQSLQAVREEPSPLPALNQASPMLADMFRSQGWVTSQDETGVTTEIDFGVDTSLFQIMAETHPDYGPGVLFLVHYPVGLESGPLLDEVLNRSARHLNEQMGAGPLTEQSTFGVGAWAPNPALQSISLSIFLPAAMADASTIVNLGLNTTAHGRHVGEAFGEEIAGPGPSVSAVERDLPKGLAEQDWWSRTISWLRKRRE